MRLSRFVLTYRGVQPGEHVLYDVIEDRYIGVDDLVLEQLETLQRVPDARVLNEEVEAVLREQDFLVTDDSVDDERLRRFLEASSEGVPGAMFVTVMPTLVCNLACTYCFQKEHPSFTKMQHPTEAATLEWILKKVDGASSRLLNVHFFGGEPLTRKDYVLRMSEVLSASMRARGAAYQWSITTNGVGLDVEFVNKMLTFGPGSIKVTLDGDKETHDAARVYRSGKGSFDEIFGRLTAVAKGCPDVQLRVGGNFRADQIESYERLLNRFEEAGLAGLIHQFRFKPVVDTGKDAQGTCTSCAGGESEARLQMRLEKAIEERGLAREKAPGVTPTGPCELHWKHSYVIDPEGLVYKCPAVAGRAEMAVGSVLHKGIREKIAPLVELRPWEKCGDCPYLPVCVGGCLGGRYLQTGRRDEVFCRRDQFDIAFRDEVQGRYLAEFAEAVPDQALGQSAQPGVHP